MQQKNIKNARLGEKGDPLGIAQEFEVWTYW